MTNDLPFDYDVAVKTPHGTLYECCTFKRQFGAWREGYTAYKMLIELGGPIKELNPSGEVVKEM